MVFWLHRCALCIVVTIASGNKFNDLITDYFVFKNTSSVFGFTCNSNLDDLILQKTFNKLNISCTLGRFLQSSDILRALVSKYQKLGVFADLRCQDGDSLMTTILDTQIPVLYGELHVWLMIVPSVQTIVESMNDLPLGLSSDFVVATPFSNIQRDDTAFNFYDVYNPAKELNCSIKITQCGIWNYSHGLGMQLTSDKIKRRSNLNKIQLRASFVVTYRPKNVDVLTFLSSRKNPLIDTLPKYGYVLLQHLSDMYNFSLLVKASPWNGSDVLGPVVRSFSTGHGDISGSLVSMSGVRLNLAKFTLLSHPFRSCFIFRSPAPSSMNILLLLKPLRSEIWKCFGITSLIVSSCLCYMLKFENAKSLIMRFVDSLFLIVTAICQQGTDYAFKRPGTRSVYLHLIILCFIIYNYYSASIVSIRISGSIKKINDSLNQLSLLNLKMSSEPLSYFYFWAKRKDWETQSFYNRSWVSIPETEKFKSPEVGVRLVQEGNYAYHTHPETMYPLIENWFDNKEICELTEVHLNQNPTFLAVNYNSSFYEMTKIGGAKMIETGIRTRELLKFSWRKPLCRPDILSVTSVDIYETAYTMLLLVLGFFVSIFLLVIERVIFYQWFIITFCKECGKRIELVEDIRIKQKLR